MTSTLKQARLFFQSIPVSGATKEDLAQRCQSNWSALDVWAANGNARAVQQAGSGRLALCAWIAAKALADDARIEAFQRKSGISQKDFAASEKIFTAAIQSSRKSGSNPSTPRRNGIYRNFEPSSSGSQPSPRSQDQTPEAREKRIRDVMSGAAFAPDYSNNSPIERRSQGDDVSAPSTPTKMALRDRSSIKVVRSYDNNVVESTPTKKTVVFEKAPSSSQASKRSYAAVDDLPASPSKQARTVERRRHKILVGYPFGEPLRKGRFEYVGEWDSSQASNRVKQYITALDRCRDTSGWEEGEIMGQIRVAL